MNSEIYQIGVNALKKAYFVQKELFKKGDINKLINFGRGQDKATGGIGNLKKLLLII